MDTAVAENVGNTIVGGCAHSKSKIDPNDGRGEGTTVNDFPNAWKVNRELTSGNANNVPTPKTLHSTNGIASGGNSISGPYSPVDCHQKDSTAKPRHKYNKPAPKIVVPIVTDREEDWPTLGKAAISKAITGPGSNGTGLLNGFATKNHKRSTSTTDSPSTSSRTNSIIGQDEAERASVVSGEGGDAGLDVDQVDGELANKLQDLAMLKPEDTELPKETNNNETGKSEDDEKKNKSKSGRGKLKWKPLPLPAIAPNRPLRPRRWEDKDSPARNGVVNGPTRVSHSTITNFANSSNENSQHGASNNATSTVQRGRGHNRTSVNRGGHHDYHGHNEGDEGHFVDYYDDRRRHNNYGGRAYYGGRPRGGGPGRWQHSHGSVASRNNRQEDEDDAIPTASAEGSQSNGDACQSRENHLAGNGGGTSISYAGAISNSNGRTGGRNGDYSCVASNTRQTDLPPQCPQYAEVAAVSYPYDGAVATIVTTVQSTLPASGLTITTTVMDHSVLSSCSPSPNISTTLHQYIMPYSRSTPSPLVSSPSASVVPLSTPTTMEQVVDEERLRTMVTKQITYYLSEENLQQDFYLRRQMNPDGYIDIGILAGFHRLKGMTSNLALILEVILSCPDKFEVNVGMTHVRPRLNPTMWPVVIETEIEQAPDSASTESTDADPVVSYNSECPPVAFYSVPSVSSAVTTIAGENNGHQVQSISSASSTSSLACTSSSLSPGLLRPFKLNPDVPEFVPKGFGSPAKKSEPADKSA